MNFIIVDDSSVFRDSVKYLLEKMYNHQVIAEASSGEEYLDIPNFQQADITLMDIEMPGMNGIEAVKRALAEYNDLKFIAVTSYRDKAYLVNLVSAGFKACIFKDNLYNEISETLHKVFNNELHFPNDILIDENDNA